MENKDTMNKMVSEDMYDETNLNKSEKIAESDTLEEMVNQKEGES